MDEVLGALRRIEKELDEQKKAITERKKLTEKMKNLEHGKTRRRSKKNWKIKNKGCSCWKDKQGKEIEFGIEENEKSYTNLVNNIIAFTEKYLSKKLNCNDIQETRRIGKKSEKPRPITVTFATLQT
ncbi:Endonuclease-reverse transcriptase [Operophtera brumata]|uniref:Endonuclease-reverse transcriptase n=1 Tax=Operophtera brumata TaxID=104452 RepID=A0A0L7KYJ0_OPEBR|nr:Endonuclease-reverse transcriptase [Operophtera brumata]